VAVAQLWVVRLSMIEYKYSTFAPRLAAGFIDGLIFWPVGWLFSFAFSHSTSAFIQVPIYIVSSSAFLVYSIWMHGKLGQTLGKMACKVVVLDVSERPLSMKQAVLRDILGVVLLPIGLAVDIPRIIHGVDIYAPTNITPIDWTIMYSTLGWFVIEVVTMLTNNKRRALHDFIAGSVVIRKPNTALEPTATAPSVLTGT
jgi:uncharacterized RDD family membrane protein YckC